MEGENSRGRIHKLVVENFKSYRQRHEIGPFLGFTCIVGPNGSGKSNVMDAISFVLGVRTAQLRGSKMLDLVHQDLRSTFSEAMEDCYVELVFERPGEGDMIHFKRSIAPSGSAEYLIDSKKVSWKQYLSKLEENGVFVQCRNFLVFQGDVESIAQMKGMELTKMIESLSGSDEFIDEYRVLQGEVQELEETYMKSFEKKKGIASEKKSVQQQKSEAETYKKLIQKKEELQRQALQHRLVFLRRSISSLTEEKANLTDQFSETREKLKKLKAEQKRTMKALGHDRLGAGKLQKSLAKLDKQLNKTKSDHLDAQEHLSHLESQEQRSKKHLQQIENSQKQTEAELDRIRQSLRAAQEALDVLDQTEQSQQTVLDLSDSQTKEYHALRDKAATVTLAARESLDRMDQELYLKRKSHEEHQLQHQRKLKALKALEEPIAKLKERETLAEKSMGQLSNDLELKRANHESTQTKRIALESEKEELTTRLDEVSTKLDLYKTTRQVLDKESRLEESLHTLKRLYPSILGKLSQLVKPSQQKYAVAMKMGLISNYNSIVVESESVAMEAIQYLKTQRTGTASFLPLDALDASAPHESLRSLGGSFKPLSDVLVCDTKVSKALLYACGDTLVCDSLKEARELAFGRRATKSYKIVTLDGAVLHKNGNMSGGAVNDDPIETIDPRELSELRDEKDYILKALSDLEDPKALEETEKQFLFDISQMEERLRFAKSDLKVLLKELNSFEARKRQFAAELDAISIDMKQSAGAVESIVSKRTEIESGITEKEENVFGDFSRRVGIRDIHRIESQRMEKLQETQKERKKLIVLTTKLQSELDLLLQSDLGRSLSELYTQLESIRQSVEEKRQLIQKTLETKELIEAQRIELDREVLDAQAEIQLKEQILQSIETELSESSAEFASTESKVSEMESEIEAFKSLSFDLAREGLLDQIEVPLRRPLAEDMSLEGKVSFILEFVDEEGVDITETTLESITKHWDEKISEILSELVELAPNLRSIEQYPEIAEKYKQCALEFSKAQGQFKQSSTKFENVLERRRAKFMEAFDVMSSAIDSVYKDLTRSSKFPMGGAAYLALENSERPFDGAVNFHAMPPQKRFRDMEQLSGGEKTVAALALLFAMQKHRPSPFFVLDEIDAALDSANISKVSRYIQEMASEGLQCIVVSLKDSFFEKADGLVGVYRDPATMSSGVLTMDLRPFTE